MPGQIAVTPILCGSSSARSDCERPSTANLLATYAVTFGAGKMPRMLEMFTT